MCKKMSQIIKILKKLFQSNTNTFPKTFLSGANKAIGGRGDKNI